jgi:hypothetical protein
MDASGASESNACSHATGIFLPQYRKIDVIANPKVVGVPHLRLRHPETVRIFR